MFYGYTPYEGEYTALVWYPDDDTAKANIHNWLGGYVCKEVSLINLTAQENGKEPIYTDL